MKHALLSLGCIAALAMAGATHGWWTAQASVRTAMPALGNRATCEQFKGVPPDFGPGSRAGMVLVPGGRFLPGSTNGYPDEQPTGAVSVKGFWMDRTEVTNAQFATFVAATGHVTDAERQGSGVVFTAPPRGRLVAPNSWWKEVAGANWRQPEGPGSHAADHPQAPVVLLSRADAQAYARWLGRELPSEDEWEWAALGGGDPERLERAAREPRGADGTPVANYWQGSFPDINTAEDGHAGRAPVGCYAANGYGLHDLIGNVWEWTRDRYRGPRKADRSGDPGVAAVGGRAALGTEVAVIKGGSFLCAPDYCVRYRASARHPQEADLGTSHVGFRTVLRMP